MGRPLLPFVSWGSWSFVTWPRSHGHQDLDLKIHAHILGLIKGSLAFVWELPFLGGWVGMVVAGASLGIALIYSLGQHRKTRINLAHALTSPVWEGWHEEVAWLHAKNAGLGVAKGQLFYPASCVASDSSFAFLGLDLLTLLGLGFFEFSGSLLNLNSGPEDVKTGAYSLQTHTSPWQEGNRTKAELPSLIPPYCRCMSYVTFLIFQFSSFSRSF